MAEGLPATEGLAGLVSDRRLDMLVVDWQQARDDERTFALVLATLFGVAIPIIAAASSFLFKTCPRTSTNCSELPHWSFAFLPLIPMLVLGYWVISAAISVMRGYYLRALEDELAKRGTDLDFGEYGTVRSPGISKLLLPMVSHRRGLFPYVILFPLLFITSFVLAIGLTAESVWRTDSTPLRVITGITYGAYLGVLGLVSVSSGLQARHLLPRLVRKYHAQATFARASQERETRSLASYLFVPRPLDLIKVSFVSAGILLAFLFNRGTPRPAVWALIVFVLAFELLVYHARYMRNDFADLRLDSAHPRADHRRRVPSLNTRAALAAFELVFAGRLLAAAAVAVWLWLRVGTRVGVAFVAGALVVWLVGEVYERLKISARRFHVPPPLFPRASPQVALFVWVGVGYGLRLALGVFVGSSAIAGTFGGITTLCLLSLWGIVFGAMFVTMTWALEASSFVAKGGTRYDQGLRDRAHLGALAVESGLLAANAEQVPQLIDSITNRGCERLPALLASSSIRATWNSAYVIALFLSSLVGISIASDWRPSGMALAAGAGAAVVSAIVATSPLVLRFPPIAFLAVLAAASAVNLAFASVVGARYPWLAVVPTAAVVATYLCFRMTTYDALLHPFAPLKPLLATTGAALERALLGRGVLTAAVEEAKSHLTPDQIAASNQLRPRRRVMRIVIESDTLAAAVAQLRPASAVVDLEPLVCTWGSDDAALCAGLKDVLRLLAEAGTISMVAVVTNSPRTPSVMPEEVGLSVAYRSAARKPWLALSTLGSHPEPTIVIGDQPLTDGLTAWRLQAPFLQIALPPDAPLHVRLQRTFGGLLAPLVFRTRSFAPHEVTGVDTPAGAGSSNPHETRP